MTTLLAAALFSGAALADTLVIEGIAPDATIGQPARGDSKEDVRAVLGEPVTETAAVGEPPISRWEYDGFVVYFEYDLVLHSVAKR